MKLLFFICAVLLSAVSFADDLPKPDVIRGYGTAQGEQAILYSNAFENRNIPGMKLMNGFKIVPGEGSNGTSALKISAKNPNKKVRTQKNQKRGHLSKTKIRNKIKRKKSYFPLPMKSS